MNEVQCREYLDRIGYTGEVAHTPQCLDQLILAHLAAIPFENLDAVTPVIQTVPGWQKDISTIRKYEDLPYYARKYIETLESLLHHDIQFISVGAKREEYLLRGAWL